MFVGYLFSGFVVGCFVSFLWVLYMFLFGLPKMSRMGLPMPPIKNYFLGHVLLFKEGYFYETCAEMKEKYGPVVQLWIFNWKMVSLGEWVKNRWRVF